MNTHLQHLGPILSSDWDFCHLLPLFLFLLTFTEVLVAYAVFSPCCDFFVMPRPTCPT
jgi:hypothetical protein